MRWIVIADISWEEQLCAKKAFFACVGTYLQMKATDEPWPHAQGEKKVFKRAPTTL